MFALKLLNNGFSAEVSKSINLHNCNVSLTQSLLVVCLFYPHLLLHLEAEGGVGRFISLDSRFSYCQWINAI